MGQILCLRELRLVSPQHRLGALFLGQEYRRESRRLARGERVVLYTDGIPERRTADGGFLGLEGIERVLAELPGAPAAAIVRALQDAVVQASPEPLDDDAATVVLAVA